MLCVTSAEAFKIMRNGVCPILDIPIHKQSEQDAVLKPHYPLWFHALYGHCPLVLKKAFAAETTEALLTDTSVYFRWSPNFGEMSYADSYRCDSPMTMLLSFVEGTPQIIVLASLHG